MERCGRNENENEGEWVEEKPWMQLD